MDRITMTAPAKINLMLDVTGKRPDGYHTIVTIMQSISLCDKVTLSKSSGITVKCSDTSIPCDERNIAYKSAAEFFKCAEIDGGVCIELEKHIPSEAGLGGGSADGAAVIVGLNTLYGTGFSAEKLCEIGAAVGADVPFCIVGGTKLCQGIGGEISPLPPLEPCFIVIGKGMSGISTKEAYRKIDSLDRSEPCKGALLYSGALSSMTKLGRNIFEQVTENKNVDEIKRICTDCGSVHSAMSGSGSAVFGLFREKKKAEVCTSELNKKGFFAAICQPLENGAVITNVN